MIGLLKHRRLALFVACGLISFAGCVKQATPQATPEATKKFLKLRGYHFDDEGFFAAAAARDVDAVKAYLQAGMNPNVQDPRDGRTVLISAAARGDCGVGKAMLEGNADPNVKNKVGGTPLMWASVYGHDEAVKFLLKRKADPNLKDQDGLTARDWAVKNHRSSVVSILRSK